MIRIVLVLVLALVLTPLSGAVAQEEILSVPFESVPEGVKVVGGGEEIVLQGDVVVGGELDTTGEVATGVGVRFPDGSLQVSAGAAGAGASGPYGNRIPDFTPPNAYTEICIKGGEVLFDIHSASEPTTGGDCVPGDLGWVLERFERNGGAASSWRQAQLSCLKDGMRLPEVLEYQLSCDDAAVFALTDMTDGWEWASNQAVPMYTSASGLSVVVMGSGSCNSGSFSWVARGSGSPSNQSFRCAL